MGYITGITERIKKSGLAMSEIIQLELDKWNASDKKRLMAEAEKYYRNRNNSCSDIVRAGRIIFTPAAGGIPKSRLLAPEQNVP